MSAETTRFLTFSCTHCPKHDPQAVAWLLNKIAEHKPALIVHLGDGHEADAASKWGSEEDFDLKYEFESHNAMLTSIRKAARRGTRLVWLPGNHDENILTPMRVDRKLRSLCNFYDLESEFASGAWEVGCAYEYHRKRGTFKVGPVTFAHGYEHGSSSDENHAILLGQPYGLTITGHTHRPTPYIMRARKSAMVPLPFWFANPGTLRDMNPLYMQRKRKVLWGQAIVVGECDNSKSPRLARDNWDAHVEVFRMSEDV